MWDQKGGTPQVKARTQQPSQTDTERDSLRPAPWDDPENNVWKDAVVELPEEYRQYIRELLLEGCYAY
jgi:hypothetical protein